MAQLTEIFPAVSSRNSVRFTFSRRPTVSTPYGAAASPATAAIRQPAVRQGRVTITREDRPVEWSDGRYRAGGVTFGIRDSVDAGPSVRRVGDLRPTP
ncbi:hypothetical protein [Streptosporangium sp. NBC_01756]|uniref:hypothetical protein n=1 Tax=Streptosporangium sp. NBC_01756 TaxID=2975950 RepID=UPI002DD8E17B|nr:hypothetical protein [Streptosporangium sp. NBC_01756]WSC88230.1 hypothetical protein OIE48_08585 [Streptosporangium sp. NBC_01756]